MPSLSFGMDGMCSSFPPMPSHGDLDGDGEQAGLGGIKPYKG